VKVSKVLKNVCSSTYRIKVEHLCAKARLLFLEVLEVAFDRLPALYPEHKVSQGKRKEKKKKKEKTRERKIG
jgi:hypothetical protein